MITIDGSEGGGQILRSALGLSAITGKTIKITNIRKGKPGGAGLKTQHLQGLLAVGKLCNAEVKGAKLDSTEIEFVPRKPAAKELDVEIPTAGSIGLLFQSLQIPSAFARGPVKINVEGGSTASKWSPPVHYIQNVFLPIVGKMGYNADIKIVKEGFYPVGGAEVEILVEPVKELNSIDLTKRGNVKLIKGISVVGSLPGHIAERQAKSAEMFLEEHGYETRIERKVVKTASPGTSITLWAKCGHTILGADALGKKGKPAEKVGREGANELLESIESRATLDKYMADQVVPFIALGKGKSIVTVERVTEHCKTNISVTEKILGVKFRIDGNRIEVNGIGHKR